MRTVSVAVVLLHAALAISAAAPAVSATAPFDDPGSIRLEDYFPDSGAGYDETVPRPESVLGHEIGERFARHDQVVAWFEALAATSPRVTLVDIGTTHEGRRQITAIISSVRNIDRLSEIQRHHEEGDISAPLFTWHGYSIHGNEASGVQASMAVAWYLAASQDPDVRSLLRRAVIMIDPALNPDGYGRFSSWGNQVNGSVPSADPLSRERTEPWPGGRTNHYYADLNRDWLLLQHPETVNRVKFLQRQRPHVMTDHHEMGGDSTFFFQPGVESRWHPLISEENRTLTGLIAAHHAQALDDEKRLYYRGESFDDFYPGKGSTWPDLLGTVGILFEQASTQGLVRDTRQGRLTLPMAVHNHVVATLSTLSGSLALEQEIKGYRAAFDEGAHAPSRLPGGWIFDDGGDPARAEALIEVVKGQGLDVFGLTDEVKAEGVTYRPGHAWVLPVLGPRAGLAHTLFATVQEFEDSTFYDVSAWSLAYAFGVSAAPLSRLPAKLDTGSAVIRDYGINGRRNAVAWVMGWEDFFAPAALQRLQAAGVRTRVALKSFTATANGTKVEFGAGSVVIHASDVPDTEQRPAAFLEDLVDGLAPLTGLDRGGSVDGPDLGSPRIVPLDPTVVGVLAGEGVNGYALGSIWHMLDQRLRLPATLVQPDRVTPAFLDRHTHLIVPDGEYEKLDETITLEIERWVNLGGTLIVTRRAADWARSHGWLPELPRDRSEVPPTAAYGSMARLDGAGQIGGSILAVTLDPTHPISFGIEQNPVGLLRRGDVHLVAPENNPFAVVGAYPEDPLISGYLPEGYEDQLVGRPAILAVPTGEGVVVAFAEDPAFRGIWWVGQRLLANAISFSSVIRPPKGRYGPREDPR